jgi:endonuclease/exonuclease/phosphatase family metal-dependent hydrolase
MPGSILGRSRLLAFAAMLSCCICTPGAQAQPLEAMTYNIRYAAPGDGDDAWPFRKARVAALLNFYEPDVLGLQEAEHQQLRYLAEALPEYRYTGVGRDDGLTGGEYAPIFYDARRLRLLVGNTFWLSETPAVPSIGWDAALKRVCTYARFEDLATSRQFWVFNAHFDHLGAVARANSAALIRDEIGRLNVDELPVLLMGDFNALPGSEPLAILLAGFDDAGREASHHRFGPDGTYVGFRVGGEVPRRIDYILTSSGGWRVARYAVLSHSQGGRYPSDHLPVFVEAEPLP